MEAEAKGKQGAVAGRKSSSKRLIEGNKKN